MEDRNDYQGNEDSYLVVSQPEENFAVEYTYINLREFFHIASKTVSNSKYDTRIKKAAT